MISQAWQVWRKMVRALFSRCGPQRRQSVSLHVEILETRIVPDGRSASAVGVNARDLMVGDGKMLTGDKILIGEIDHLRVGSATNDDNSRYTHPDVNPKGVYHLDKKGDNEQGAQMGAHPLWVAGIMNSTSKDKNKQGIAPGASLYSSGFDLADRDTHDPKLALISMFQIASLKPNPVAINMSFGFPAIEDGKVNYQLDGSSQLSLGADYLSKKYNTLFVIAKGQGLKGAIPQDSFNGVVVGGAAAGGDGGFQVTWPETDFTTGTQDRRLIDIIAPADGINVPMMGSKTGAYQLLEGKMAGTSLAAPHVTGAVALLQQYVTQYATWAAKIKDLAAQHEVMKAVLLNSADKLRNVLGSKRDVFHIDKKTTWAQSDARDDPTNQAGRAIPLDLEFGAGFLNVGRALQQLQGGRAEPYAVNDKPGQDGKLPKPPDNPKNGSYINWDYGTIERKAGDAAPVYNRYLLPELKKDDWISATLTWDRVIDAKNEKNPIGAGFVVTPGLADLNLYLMKVGETDITKNVWSSVSSQYNLEDFLVNIPADGKYELWVEQNSKTSTNYALAWWATPPKPGKNDKKIEGKMWYDQNQDDRRQSDEPPVAYATVELHDAATGALLDTRLTNYNGEYSIDAAPGNYYVTFQRLFGYAFDNPHVGEDVFDSDVDSGGRFYFTISPTDSITVIDAGLKLEAQTASISDFVWNDKNGDGVRESEDHGVGSVTVSLYSADRTFVGSTQTDSSGRYTFSSLPADQYFVQVDLPQNYVFTAKHAGSDDLLDSDANPDGTTDVFSLSEGEQKQGISAGIVLVGGTIAGSVWHHDNANGIRDSSETPVADNLLVQLYDASTDRVVAQSQTADDGSYQFTSIAPGSYYVVVQSDGSRFTTKSVGTDGTVDSDVGPSGRTDSFNFTLGQTVSNLDAGLIPIRINTSNANIDQWQTYTGVGSFTDPGATSWTATVNYGDGSADQPLTLNPDHTFNLSHVYVGPGIYAVTVIIVDNADGQGAAENIVTVARQDTVTLNRLNTTTTAIVSFDDGAGHSGSVNTYLTQFNVTYTGGPGAPITFDTFCIDLLHEVTVSQTYAVNVRNDVGAAFANGFRMAYIFDHYGRGDFTTDPDTAAAVQLALWDLSLNNHNPTFFSLDADGTYSSGDENVFAANLGGNPDAAMIASLADYYLKASIGATTPGSWLDAAAAGDAPNRGQSLLIPQPQFGNQPVVTGVNIDMTEGIAASSLVAAITEGDPNVQAADFQSTINWGDGSAPDSNTTIVANGSGGFDVHGSHTYAEEGNYALTITVALGTTQATANGTALVEDAPLTTQPLVPTFAAAAGSPVAAGNTPDSIGTLTLDNGQELLLVANFYGNNVSVAESNGDGTFTSLSTLASGAGPNGFAVGDFNGAGHQSFAIANYYSNTISVFLGDGTGGFTAAADLGTGSGPANELASGDFDHNGTFDLATADLNDGTVSVFLGNGDGTFAAAATYNVGVGIDAITVGDFRGNGETDLAVGNFNNSTVTILQNQGDGTFTVGNAIAVGANPWYITAGDFTGSGRADVATANFYGGVSVLLSNGDGTFQNAVNYTVGSNPTGIVAADINGNGTLDLVTSNYGSNNASILLGNGDGTFQAPLNFAAGAGPNGIAVADVNGDNKLDIVVANQNSNDATVLLNTSLQAVVGQPFQGVLASFTDANPLATPAEYSAFIDWGDGTTSQVGAEAFSLNANGGFDLTANHTYTDAGSHTFTVTISDDGGSFTIATNAVYVRIV